ncbi:MAG: hypothetical protein A2Z96_03470 [Spirochaetes bacterium GWB1_48_6]|nr:MAG: hypothetical protein A2Z96_03470 [Spirochaetes bacterium GWB1_48_6]
MLNFSMSKKIKILMVIAVGTVLVGGLIQILLNQVVEKQSDMNPAPSKILMTPPARLPVMTPPTAPPPQP